MKVKGKLLKNETRMYFIPFQFNLILTWPLMSLSPLARLLVLEQLLFVNRASNLFVKHGFKAPACSSQGSMVDGKNGSYEEALPFLQLRLFISPPVLDSIWCRRSLLSLRSHDMQP